ncbi:MAG: BON domain-containing protein [Desulfovibrio sp.]|jgi:osmotically-inducible protein OsmY|nr:BON domain-containing protein [Desulfovibrio sp.]
MVMRAGITGISVPAAAVTALLHICACSVIQPAPRNIPREESRYDDADIRTELSSILLGMDPSAANGVGVYCFNGRVFLIGEADKEFRSRALEAARQVPGVKEVAPHWFPAGSGHADEDAAVAAAIEELPLFAGKVAGVRVAVDVRGGHVVLVGLAPAQADIDSLVREVKRVSHVKSVTSYILPD